MRNLWLSLVSASTICVILGLSLWLVQRPVLSNLLLRSASGAPEPAKELRDHFIRVESEAEFTKRLAEFNSNWPEWGLTNDEISHLVDVWALVHGLQLLGFVGAGVLLMSGWKAWQKRVLPNWYRGIFWGGAVQLAGLFLVSIFMLVKWNWFFVVFHKLGFPQGNWAFPLDSNLIAFFPEVLWYRFGWVWVGLIAGLSCVVSVLGWRGWHSLNTS